MFLQTPSLPPVPPPPAFMEVSKATGLGGRSDSRIAMVDLNGDGRPDLVLGRRMVWLNTPSPTDEHGFHFVQSPTTLPDLGVTAVTAFADFDNDGKTDGVIAADLDPALESDHAVVFCKGHGDGTFAAPVSIAALRPAHSAALAVGDVNGDGRLDLYRGNWYVKYGEGLEGTPDDLLVQQGLLQIPECFARVSLPEDRGAFTEEQDAGGRPTYGAMIAHLGRAPQSISPVQIAQLSYGRRWNRLYSRTPEGWMDFAHETGFDGDGNRSGTYPAWLTERAKTDKRFDRPDEKPFRSNGNTFDMAVADVNGDGQFDCFLAEIAHAWAGESSDRSRFLISEPAANQLNTRFVTPAWACVDRIPSGDGPESRGWNQGDLFCELADVNNDGMVDLILASGDYPDAAPFDERLRVFLQRETPGPDGRKFVDHTQLMGIDLPGAAQLAVGDLDLDGDVDIVCGQSFTRFTPAMIQAAGGTPQLRVYLNTASQSHALGTTLLLTGDPAQQVPRDAIGSVISASTVSPTTGKPSTVVSQLIGPGGHSGKQRAFQVHFGGTTPQTVFHAPKGVALKIHGPGVVADSPPSPVEGKP